MTVSFSIRPINSLKDFAKYSDNVKQLKSFNVKESEDADYRSVSINIAKEIYNDVISYNGMVELRIETDKNRSVTPFKKSDFKDEGKFTLMQDCPKDERVPNALCETIYDSVCDGFGIKSKYL